MTFSGPTARWSASLARPAWGVAVAGERAFLSIGDRVRAYALDTGRGLWEATADGPADQPHSAPVVAGARVLVATPDGGVEAFDTSSGHLDWAAPDATERGSPSFVAGVTPVLTVAEEQGVVIAVGGGRASAYGLADGDLRWVRPDVQYAPARVSGATSMLTVQASAETGGARLVGLDVATGAPTWEATLDGRVPARPDQDGHRAAVRVDDRLVAVDVRDGMRQTVARGDFAGIPMVVGGSVVTGTPAGAVAYGLDGGLRWRRTGTAGDVVTRDGTTAVLVERGIRAIGIDIRDGRARFVLTPSGWFGDAAIRSGELVLATLSPTHGRLAVYDLGS